MVEAARGATQKKRWYQHPWLWAGIGLVVLWFGGPLVADLLSRLPLAQGSFTPLPGATGQLLEVFEVTSDDDPALGPRAAPVVVVEFGDFQCPFCREAAPVVRRLLERYPEAVRLIYRDFPVGSIHAEAVSAATAANCAAAQGKFWDYHDALFSQQDSLGEELYLGLAQRFGLETEQWSGCRQAAATVQEIEDDFRAGLAAGVRGTPTFFVNGRRVEGAVPLEVWLKIIAAEVSRKFSPDNN